MFLVVIASDSVNADTGHLRVDGVVVLAVIASGLDFKKITEAFLLDQPLGLLLATDLVRFQHHERSVVLALRADVDDVSLRLPNPLLALHDVAQEANIIIPFMKKRVPAFGALGRDEFLDVVHGLFFHSTNLQGKGTGRPTAGRPVPSVSHAIAFW